MTSSGLAFRVVPLASKHDRDSFSCGSEPLDRYLRRQARQDAEKRVAAAFVLIEPNSPKIFGYYTLSASVIDAKELPPALAKKMPRYAQLPVTLLGRLAVDQSQRGKRLGEYLLMDAMHRSLVAAVEIAAMAMVVDAKDEAAESFYEHFDFAPLHTRPSRLFLPMITIATLFPGE